MTTPELSEALDAIERQAPAVVHAGRKGHTIGIHYSPKDSPNVPKGHRLTLIFRREADKIAVEEWRYDNGTLKEIRRNPLTSALAERAARLMDR